MTDYFDEWVQDSEKSLAPVRFDLAPHRAAIATIETGSPEGDYRRIGPKTRTGDRAHGKYQIMGDNIPSWSKAALGREVSVQEFLDKPEIQDKIFDHQFGKYLQKYGPKDAASLWFTGLPYEEGKKKDDRHWTGEKYVSEYLKALAPAAPQKQGSLEDLDQHFAVEFLDKEYPQKAPPQEQTPTEVAAQVSPPVEIEKTPQAQWSAFQNMVGEALLGQGQNISAFAQAGREGLGDVLRGVPVEQAYKLARDVYFPEAKSQYQGAQESWAKANPGTEVATKLGGQMLPIMAGVGAGNALLRGVGTAVPRLAPAANFLMGTGGEGMSGVGGFLTRRASDTATGALQGAGASAITGEDPGTGAAFGAGLGLGLGGVMRTLTAPMRATARPEVARAAEDYLNAGGTLPAGAIIDNAPMAKTVAALAGKGEADAIENFTLQFADRIGARPFMEAEGVKGLTPKVLADVKQDLYQQFDDFAATRGVNVDKQFVTELHSIAKDAQQDLAAARPETVKAVNGAIQRVIDTAMNQKFHMTGKEFRALTSKDSVLDKLFEADHAAVPYAERLKETLYSALERTLPEARQEIDALRGKYRDLLRIEKVASSDTHGLLNPKKVANRFGKSADDFGDTARMGKFLPVPDPAGNVAGADGKGLLARIARHMAPGVGAPFIGAGAGAVLAEHGLGWLPQALSAPVEAAGVLAGAGLGLGAKNLYGGWLGSPEFTRRVIENTLRPTPKSVFQPATLGIPLLSQREETWR